MKRFLIILFCLSFSLNGAASAWADCFKHHHNGTDEEHHHSGIVAGMIHHGDSEDDHSAPRFHCPPSQFDLDAVVPAFTTSKPKQLESKYKLSPRPDLSAQQFSFNIESRSIEAAGKFLSYPFLIGISPHLLLSVFRI